MKVKIGILTLIAILIVFSAFKVRNFVIGQKISGDLSVSSESLKFKPIKKIIDTTNIGDGLHTALYSINFVIPKTDVVKSFRIRDVYESFKFSDSSVLKVFRDSSKINYIKILSESSKEVEDSGLLGKYLKSNHINSNFDFLLHVYNKMPDDISFFILSRDTAVVQYTLLKMKGLLDMVGEDTGFSYFELKHLSGFQFGSPNSSKIVQLQIFTNQGNEYLFNLKGFSQKHIDAIIGSLDEN